MRTRNRSASSVAHPSLTENKSPIRSVPPNALPLTTRQLEIARYIVTGKTAREIAIRLTLSRRTVESHIDALKMRLDCVNRCELTEKLVRLGIELDD